MWEWIATWTFWNWLTIILVVPALVGFLNAVLSLKSRYTDWSAKRNKETLKKRLLELEQDAIDTKIYHMQPTALLIDLLQKTTTPIRDVVISLIFSSFALLILSPILSPSRYLIPLLFGIWINTFFKILKYLNLIERKISYFYYPSKITNKAEQLIKDAKTLGVISDIDIKTIQIMIEEKRLKDTNDLNKNKLTVDKLP